jgi:putative nucleotidyltransferase with HDIG domain
MPRIADQVIRKLSEPRTSTTELETLIGSDQALAARVIKMANAAHYGYSRGIASLRKALLVIGFNTVRSLVVAAAIHDFFKSFRLVEKLLWEHSLGCGFGARIIARKLQCADLEEAFLAGLLHDIGKVMLNLKLPQETSGIIQQVYNDPEQTAVALEQERFGFDHAEVGALVARKWNFAAPIEEAIGKHHAVSSPEGASPLTHTVSLANKCCHKLSIGPSRFPQLDVAACESAAVLQLDGDAVSAVLDGLAAAFRSAGSEGAG